MNITKENIRHRYICFNVKSMKGNIEISREDIIKELKNKCSSLFNTNCYSKGIRLIRFDGKNGIVKCKHTEKENTIKLLNSISNISAKKVKVETFGTSGTIKALIRKHMT